MPKPDRSAPSPRRDPEEEGSAAKHRQRPNPPDTDPEEEGSAGRSQR
jgi:hypothetical protein